MESGGRSDRWAVGSGARARDGPTPGTAPGVAGSGLVQREVELVGQRGQPGQHVAQLVELLFGGALADGLGQLAHLLAQPGDGGGHAPFPVPIAKGGGDLLLEGGDVHGGSVGGSGRDPGWEQGRSYALPMAARGSLSDLVSRVKRTLSASGGSSSKAKRSPRSGSGSSARGPQDRSADFDPARNGGIAVSYAPERDGDADPGEVAWAWVPYEDDPSQGKDRPVLVIGLDRDGRLAAVPLSSRDPAERRDAHEWIPVGTGAWDSQRRPSYADASRLLRLAPDQVRREGAALDRGRFEAVLERVSGLHGWRS